MGSNNINLLQPNGQFGTCHQVRQTYSLTLFSCMHKCVTLRTNHTLFLMIQVLPFFMLYLLCVNDFQVCAGLSSRLQEYKSENAQLEELLVAEVKHI